MSDFLLNDVPGCVYLSTAPAAPATPPLDSAIGADVAVVGAGYTGLSAALALAERGHRVAVLEAFEPGWGAAGRNGGQVNPGLKNDPDAVERRFGPDAGARLVRLAGEAPGVLFDLVERLGIECEARRSGTLCVAQRAAQLPALAAAARQWQRRGAKVEAWDAGQVFAATGCTRFAGGTFDARGGSVNPLALARGLAAAAIGAGARIFGASRASRLQRDGGGWRVHAGSGSVRADAVILATDGYSDGLWPGLRTSIIPIHSSIIASAPLPAALAAGVLPAGAVVYEAGEVTMYYRRDREGRLLMGGRGPQRGTPRRSDFEHLVRHALTLWPQLAKVEWTHWWSGQFALTPDYYPRLHRPEPGLLIALGYSGRGVALATAIGPHLAAAAAGDAAADPMPLPETPIRQVPLHGLWPLAVAGRVALSRIAGQFGMTRWQ